MIFFVQIKIHCLILYIYSQWNSHGLIYLWCMPSFWQIKSCHWVYAKQFEKWYVFAQSSCQTDLLTFHRCEDLYCILQPVIRYTLILKIFLFHLVLRIIKHGTFVIEYVYYPAAIQRKQWKLWFKKQKYRIQFRRVFYKLWYRMAFYAMIFHDKNYIESAMHFFLLSQGQLLVQIFEYPVFTFLITYYISTASGCL